MTTKKKAATPQQATASVLRPICNPCNEDSDFFDHLRAADALTNIARQFSLEYEMSSTEIKKNCYIECDRATSRGKAEALFRIIAYHLNMNVADVRIYLFLKCPSYYHGVINFASKIPCKNRRAKNADDIDTIVHERVAEYLENYTVGLQICTDTVLADMDKHEEEYDNG